MSYRTLGADPNIKCNQPDDVFDQQVTAEHLDGYDAYVVAGTRGSCGRARAEQMKRLHPAKLLIAYENATAAAPSMWPGGTWLGYYLLMNRSVATAPVDATQTTIPVAVPGAFSVGDTAVMWAPTPADPYANSEWITVTAVSSSTLTVRRDIFGTGRQSYAVAPNVAAAATGSTYPDPLFNVSDVAPVNPATGERANQWLADTLVADFAPSTAGAPTLDAMELDSAASSAPVHNTNGAAKNLDCDGDGIIDYCQRNVGTNQQLDAYAKGYDDFVTALKTRLASYDTDPTRPPTMLLADGESGLRSLGALNGAEFESFPTWDDYTFSSPALATLSTWQAAAGGAGDRLSYAFTKDATPLYPQAGCITPANGGTCRNANYRYGLAAALMVGATQAYNNEASWTDAQRWDEEGTVNQATTGLSPGYLGQPLGAPVRTRRFTSAELAVNGGFDVDTTGVTVRSVRTGVATATRDTTNPGPGSVASLRVGVSGLTANPAISDVRAALALSSPVSPGEYTVEFWAKADNPLAGPSALNLGVSLDGMPGKAEAVLVNGSWQRFALEFNATTSASKPTVRFSVGQQIGDYWLDGVSVHRGTAGIVTREYTNGIAVLNDSFAAQTNVALPDGPYRRINGVQDRSVNDGTSVGSVLPTIGAKDGVVLLRGGMLSPATTVGVARPTTSATLLWGLTETNAAPADRSFVYGLPTDIPVTGDWNGDGVSTAGVARVEGTALHWYLSNDNVHTAISKVYGTNIDRPVTGDWHRTGRTNVGVARTVGTGLRWYLADDALATSAVVTYGSAGDVPVAGDWDRDGRTTIGVARASAGALRWYLSDDNAHTASVTSYGVAGDMPITGDWNADGRTTIGVARPSGGALRWYLSDDDVTTARGFSFALATDRPVAGRWAGTP